ncbi:GerAB/ArcD/ProY family transporter [Paenibacillus sp. 481]|uniref:GerAB/ArcD/ProY family transporter n=1 Tax=Paenibacillus sp. 481 TaxID=2835869 RepID=UPI001E59B8A0|nr:GerAB/ArcD/ProY family transporter [Paenibacillus sp. 481]UHA73815.1 GerAB/ArcD/ProY family transporter [Paenibacillus sp. 481]
MMSGDKASIQRLIHPSLTIPLMIVSQITIGMLAYQKYVYKEAGHDAWISVIIVGVCAHLSIFFILKMLKRFQYADLHTIHQQLFGKWVGGLLNVMMVCYWIIVSIYVLRNYIEVLQIWIFPELSVGLYSIIFLMLIGYGLVGGLRVIASISLIHLLLVGWMILLLYFPIKEADWRQLLPILEASPRELFNGVLAMGATVGGFDVIFYTSTYMKDKHEIGKYAHAGMFLVNLLYLVVMVISLGYYTPYQLENNSWGTLTLFKIVHFSFLERFEYILIMLWFIVVLANLMIWSWLITSSINKTFNFKRKHVYVMLMIVLFTASEWIQTGDELAVLSTWLGYLANVVSFIYPAVLLIVSYIFGCIQHRYSKGSAS